MVPLNDGNCRLTMAVVKGCCACDMLLHTFDISVFEFGKNNSATIKRIYNESTNLIERYDVPFDTNDRSNLLWKTLCHFVPKFMQSCYNVSLSYICSHAIKILHDIELRYNKTLLLRDTVPHISRGESAAARLTAGQPQLLTPRRRSDGVYHVTTQFCFYPVMTKIQNSTNIYPWI